MASNNNDNGDDFGAGKGDALLAPPAYDPRQFQNPRPDDRDGSGKAEEKSKAKAAKDAKEMSSLQEWLNAFAELLWTLYAVVLGGTLVSKTSQAFTMLRLAAIFGAAAGHVPFSFIYHARQALRLGDDKMDNEWRCLDQAGINVACIFYSFGTSGTFWYFFLVLAIKFNHVIEIWRPTSTITKRRLHIFTGALMHLLPIAWYRDFARFGVALGSLVAGSLCFALNDKFLGGYGSALFHLSMIPYHRAILTFVAEHGSSAS